MACATDSGDGRLKGEIHPLHLTRRVVAIASSRAQPARRNERLSDDACAKTLEQAEGRRRAFDKEKL